MKPIFACCGNELRILDGILVGSELVYDSYWVCKGCGMLWNEWAFETVDPEEEPDQRREIFNPDDYETLLQFIIKHIRMAWSENVK